MGCAESSLPGAEEEEAGEAGEGSHTDEGAGEDAGVGVGGELQDVGSEEGGEEDQEAKEEGGKTEETEGMKENVEGGLEGPNEKERSVKMDQASHPSTPIPLLNSALELNQGSRPTSTRSTHSAPSTHSARTIRSRGGEVRASSADSSRKNVIMTRSKEWTNLPLPGTVSEDPDLAPEDPPVHETGETEEKTPENDPSVDMPGAGTEELDASEVLKEYKEELLAQVETEKKLGETVDADGASPFRVTSATGVGVANEPQVTDTPPGAETQGETEGNAGDVENGVKEEEKEESVNEDVENLIKEMQEEIMTNMEEGGNGGK